MGVPQIQRTKLCSGERGSSKIHLEIHLEIQCDTNKNIGKYADTVRKKVFVYLCS